MRKERFNNIIVLFAVICLPVLSGVKSNKVFIPQKNEVAAGNAKRQIPILCYHNIKPRKAGNSTALTITPEEFLNQIKILSDSGYNAIVPDQLYAYLTSDAPLPPKAIMFT